MKVKIPTFKCIEGCSDCCKSIIVGRIEYDAISKRVGFEPKIDATVIKCSLLKDNKCTVYDIRPTICKLFGTIETLKCPYGRGPKKLLTHRQGKHIFERTLKKGIVGT